MEVTKAKILIVEDSHAVAGLLASALTESNYDIYGITDTGEEAIELVKNIPPDLIFMDIGLKGNMDGIEAARVINSIADLPIVFLTGNKDLKYIERIREVSPYAYLSKPFKINELFYTIETSLYKHRMILEVKESEERLNVIWNNIQTAIMIVEENTCIVHNINPKAAEMTGLSSSEIIGRHKNDFLIISDQVPGQECSDEAVSREAVLLNHDQEKIPVYKTSKRIKLRGNNYFLISITDASEQKKHEIDIKNARDEIQNLMSSLVTILVGVSIKDEVTHWNKIAENIFGLPDKEVLGSPLTQLKIKWDWPAIYEGIYQSIGDDTQVRLTNLHFTNGRNEPGFLDLTINPVKDKDNNFKGFILSGEDITKRKNLELKLAQAQKMEAVGELSSGIAHEINTPAQYITDNIYFLKDSFPKLINILNKYNELIDLMDSRNKNKNISADIKKIKADDDFDFIIDEIPKAISQSLEGLSRVTTIVKSMKNFAYPVSETKIFININDAIEDTINISRNEWKYVAEIVTHFDESLPLIPCFPGELNQVLLIVIINATDALKEKYGESQKQKGIIEISTGIDGERAVITVKDSGTGIPEEIITKIFDPFFTTKRAGKGTGQGLAIAYDIIVNKHSGTINFISNDGKGAVCVIKIPVKDDACKQEMENDKNIIC